MNNENTHKKDLITNREFTKLNNPPHRGHNPLPDELINDDENDDTLEETLIGMEYDLDPGDEDWDEEDDVDLDEYYADLDEEAKQPLP
jgi:hypothetical protein